MSQLPFDRYDGRGRTMLGRARQGDLTARHGYGPPVFAQCGYRCAYCAFDMDGRYVDWLQLSVDHVIPMGSVARGYRREWLIDIANQVTCCRPCNEFSNAFSVSAAAPATEDEFFAVRDAAFVTKRQLVLRPHERERARFQKRLTTGAPIAPLESRGPSP